MEPVKPTLASKVNPLTSRDDRERFMAAMEEFARTGETSVTCDKCLSAIRFKPEESITRHDCDCGKFKGVLKGL